MNTLGKIGDKFLNLFTVIVGVFYKKYESQLNNSSASKVTFIC